MKKFFIITLLLSFISAQAITAQMQSSKDKYTILLTGASFASPQNGWFEIGCRKLGATPINRAVGGEAIANTANRMEDGTLYSPEELEIIDALVIMQVHNKDVYEELQLKDSYTDYELPFDRSNYAAAYDYVIKRYITECYELRNNPKSRYYNTPYGKPAVIVLCTHWHDCRTVYNESVRKLAQKWGLPLIEFDKYISFSKNMLHPVTQEPFSTLYSTDTQETEGVVYGHHPIRGEQSYIQQRMAAIFVDTMMKILPIK